MTRVKSKEEFNRIKQLLIDNGIKFHIHSNNMSSKIIRECGIKYYFSDEEIDFKSMSFIRKVKLHIKKYSENNVIKKVASPVYYNIGSVKGKSFKNIVEVDIDSAYWETAYRLKIISRPIYLEGKRVEKNVRLIALGSIAKTTEVSYFDGNKMVDKPDIEDKKMKNIWNVICRQISDTMEAVKNDINKNHYLFFWVDAFFVKKEAVKKVCDSIKDHGYNFKIKQLKNVSIGKNYIEIDDRKFFLNESDLK